MKQLVSRLSNFSDFADSQNTQNFLIHTFSIFFNRASILDSTDSCFSKNP